MRSHHWPPPGPGSRSITVTWWPRRASAIAMYSPVGPAPTITARMQDPPLSAPVEAMLTPPAAWKWPVPGIGCTAAAAPGTRLAIAAGKRTAPPRAAWHPSAQPGGGDGVPPDTPAFRRLRSRSATPASRTRIADRVRGLGDSSIQLRNGTLRSTVPVRASTVRAERLPAGPQPAPQRTHTAPLVRLCPHGIAGPTSCLTRNSLTGSGGVWWPRNFPRPVLGGLARRVRWPRGGVVRECAARPPCRAAAFSA